MVFCVWLFFSELKRPGIDRLPTDRESAELAAQKRNDARSAAAGAIVRGELWAESAFTFADLLWADSNGDRSSASELKSTIEEARTSLDRAVHYAPTRAGVWLLAADLGQRFGWSRPDPAEALRMSYYTGPNALALMPLRAKVATQLPALDGDLQRLAQRDLRLLLAHQDKPAIIRAYQAATPAGKHFIEEGIGETDPGFVKALRRGAD